MTRLDEGRAARPVHPPDEPWISDDGAPKQEGDEVEFVVAGNTVRMIRSETNESAGRRFATRLRGRGSSGMSTDEIMGLLRGED